MEKVKILKAVDIINDSVSEYEGERPFLSTGDLNLSTITNLELHTFSEKPSRANQNVSSGDLILARMQGTVKVKLINNEDENIIVSTGFLVLRPKINADSKYLFHLLKSSNFQNDKDKLCTGATQKAINNSNFEKLEIPLPNLATQQRIAAILDQADAIIQNNRAIVQKYDALTQSLFLDMFGDPVKNEKGWEVVQVENVASNEKHSIKAGPFGSSLKKEFYVEKGYKIYGQEQVIKDDMSYGDYYIDEKKYKELESCRVKEGDILISLVGTYGKVSIIPDNFEEGIINPRLMKISPNKNIIRPDFLKFLLQSSYVEKQLKNHSRGGTMDIINVGIIRKLFIPLPSLEMQNQFAERVAVIEAQKQKAQLELAKSEELFQSLLQRAFKGELN